MQNRPENNRNQFQYRNIESMKTIPKLFILLLFSIVQLQISAQQTAYFENVQEEIETAKQLFNQEKYNAAFWYFGRYQKELDEKSELYSEAEYYKAVSALKAGHNAGSKLLDKFIEDYPESPYINNAWFSMADYEFEKRHYPVALRAYKNVDPAGLSQDDQIKMQYQTGYSNLMTDNLEDAAADFYAIKETNSIYSKPANYYWAHIMYLQENFESALQGFSKLNGDPTYSKVIPLYVSHIYYKQQRYNEVVDYTISVLDDVDEEHQVELSKIIGDSYFHLRQYEKAIPYLETYYESPGLKTREDNYLLGYSYYTTAQYEKAAPLLEKASAGNDEMAQNAYYHLADTYIKLDEKEKARVAFEAAADMDFNEKIKEDALFSYAKLTYELSYSPFNETIKAFDRYITLYPNSERNADAYRYLTEVFMVTKNYADAINTIEKIEVKSPSILRAYQRVTFLRGLELFNNFAYNQAIDFFNLSLENGSYNREMNARALYWKAEALYRVGDYANSVTAYQKFLTTPGAFSLDEYQNAEYNLGYAYFKMEDYEPAASHFRKYINSMEGKRTNKLADAYNRVGDYYFLNTNYTLARQNYQKSFDMKTFEPDYALFQIAFCQGLQRDLKGKINSLEKLQAGFPQSDYQDDALYELGRAFERLGQNYEAAQKYRIIINGYQQSAYYRRALLQMGLINYNDGNYSEALTNYKKVVENYPGSPEAQAALLGIKNSYIELNNVNEYFAYTRKLGNGVNVTSTEQDSLTYLAAERLYMSNETGATAQLQNYLKQYPNGSFALNAHFYLAESLYKQENYSQANEHYKYVANQPANIFSEPALSRASELTFNADNYAGALEYFNRLETLANSKWNVLKAYTGEMRCNLKLKNYQNAIDAAVKLKGSDVVNEALKREANYVIGKSNYQLNNFDAALAPLKEAATDTKQEQGAEAKFLMSEIYYRQNKKANAEKEIMDFIEKGTPFQFWLGKAFLLLADIYLDKGDEFQAKHTLRSIVENYGNENDGVKEKAREKLSVIEAEEQQEQQKARDSSFQMKLNEK